MLAALRRRHPEARLLVAGQGLFQEERRLPALAAARGLEGAIDDRGWVEPAQLAALMAGADVALYPFDDTLVNRSKSSVKLLELLAAGLPVVASAVGQNAEVIVDGQSGLLVAPGDAAAFAAAVSDLLDDADLRARLAAGAQARVREQFRWSLLAPKVMDLYASERP
jgi:glycosyltransferase involved in cell wall biosynthesis